LGTILPKNRRPLFGIMPESPLTPERLRAMLSMNPSADGFGLEP
jgi:hypothetical protein